MVEIQQLLYDVLSPALDFWLLISLMTTLVVVQFFKAALKHFGRKKLDPFTVTSIILLFAIATGYILTRAFLEMPSVDERRLAMAVALLNVAIYEGTLMYARKKGWVYFEALLRMKRVEATDEHEVFVGDHTMLFRKAPDAE